MVIKNCRRCGKEDDYMEDPMCDNCATKCYSEMFLFDLKGELINSTLEPKEELNRIINKICFSIESLNEDFWNGFFKCKTEDEKTKFWKERLKLIKK